jgi:hypothetical protein
MGALAGDENTQADNLNEDRMKTGAEIRPGGFNWLLPVLGALGFGIGFALSQAFMATIFNIAHNAVADIFSYTKTGAQYGILRGIIVGGIGGAGLGLAFKNKANAFYFALTGAVGFSLAFALVISIKADIVHGLGDAIIRVWGGPHLLSGLELSLAHGLGVGIFVGAIGSFITGLASSKNRLMSALLLGITGTLWFANAFAFAYAIYNGDLDSSWNGLGGAIGGAVLGLTLAIYFKILDRPRQPGPAIEPPA